MILTLFVLTVALAAGATHTWAIRETSVPYAALAAGGLWGVAALQAQNIVIYHQDGTSTTVGTEPLQWLFAGFAVLSVSVILLWYFEIYPTEEPTETVSTQ